MRWCVGVSLGGDRCDRGDDQQRTGRYHERLEPLIGKGVHHAPAEEQTNRQAQHRAEQCDHDRQTKIVTTFDLDEYVYDGLRAGASGFLLKDTRPDILLDAVRVVADGEALLAPQITRRLIEEFTTRPAPSAPAASLDVLTERERGARGAGACGPRALERGDRRDPLHEPGDQQDPRVASVDEARIP